MRRFVLVVLLTMAGLIGTARADGVPMPKDAKALPPVKGGDGRLSVYDVARGRDAVVAEVRVLLKQDGWTVADEKTPKDAPVRLTATKDARTWKIAFDGDKAKTRIVVTRPRP